MLTFLYAEGASQDFRELYQTECDAGDLDTVRFAADNGGSPTLVDVCIRDVTLQADFGSARPLEPPPPRRWPLWLAVGLSITLLATGGFWFWKRS